MKLFLKILLGTLTIIIIAVIGIAFTFDPNDYKKDIVTIVKDKTNRDLSITGDISLSLFPWIGIDLGKIEISNAKGFGKKPFAKVEHLQVRAKLWPLFEQRLEADTIVIDGLQLNLAKNKKGISNWDDLTKTNEAKKESKKQVKKAPAHKQTTEKNNPANLLGAVALNGIKIQNAQFNWDDQQQKQNVSIKDVQLSLGQLRPDTKIPFDIKFHLQEKSLETKVKFSSKLIFSSNLKQFSFYDTNFSGDIKLSSLKERLAPTFNAPLINLDLNKQTFNAKNLKFSEGEINLVSNISANKILSSPYIKGDIKLQEFNPKTVAKRFSIKLPDVQDNKVLSQLGAKFNIKGSLENINLSNIVMSLDGSKMTGAAQIKKPPYASSINLTVDAINLDRYLSKSNEKEITKKTKPTKEAALIPLALLNAFNIDASFKVNKIQIKKTHWSNFYFAANSRNGDIKINSLNMLGYDAKVQSNFRVKASGNNALLSGNLNIHNLKAGKLLNDFMGKDKLKGKTSLNVSFNSAGIKLSQLKQNLNGKLRFNLKDGTLKGFNLNHQQKVLDAKLKRKPIPKAPKPEETKIANLSATAIIKKGILTNKDLRASTPLSRVIGRGTVNIAKEKLNYVASVKFTSSTDIKFKTPFEKMKSLPLDILIRGTFDKPNIKVDFQKLLDRLVKQELDKQKKKITDKVKQDLKIKEKQLKKDLEKKVGDKLKNLFKF